MTACLPGFLLPRRPRRRRADARTTGDRTTSSIAAVLALALAATATYTIRPGDTLSAIAASNGTSVRDLVDLNGITDPDRIIAGSRLQLPTSPSGGGTAASVGTHTVASGEHLTGIATAYGISVQVLADDNGVSDRNLIREGQRLAVPGAGATAAATSTPSAPSGSASQAQAGALIEQTARAHGWNPAFVKAIAWQESGWNNNMVSSAGAIGIMQVLPATGQWVSTYLAGRTLDLADPADNVLAGVLFLDYLHRMTGGDVRLILGGYYQGLRSMRDNGVYGQTERYIDNVMALRERF